MDNRICLEALNRRECLRYLGCSEEKAENIINGPEDENIGQLIDECEKLVLEAAEPRFVYKTVDLEQTADKIILKGLDFCLPGQSIKEHLEGCEKAVLMAVTVSVGTDRLIYRMQHTDMAKAVIVDSFASVAVEQACDKAEQLIRQAYPEYYQTFRFGIGYGDLPIDIQPSFLKLLNAEKTIGLSVSRSCMLTPTKSVTAVIGLSKNKLKSKVRGCQTCNLRDTCKYRQKGGHCNG